MQKYDKNSSLNVLDIYIFYVRRALVLCIGVYKYPIIDVGNE